MLILYVDGAKHVALQCDIRDEESVKYGMPFLLFQDLLYPKSFPNWENLLV